MYALRVHLGEEFVCTLIICDLSHLTGILLIGKGWTDLRLCSRGKGQVASLSHLCSKLRYLEITERSRPGCRGWHSNICESRGVISLWLLAWRFVSRRVVQSRRCIVLRYHARVVYHSGVFVVAHFLRAWADVTSTQLISRRLLSPILRNSKETPRWCLSANQLRFLIHLVLLW